MVNMSTVNSIRQQRRDGFSISDIAKMNGVSRDTVYKYLAQDDFSPRPPARRSAPSKLDPYKPVIRQQLEDDAWTGASSDTPPGAYGAGWSTSTAPTSASLPSAATSPS